MIFKIKIQKMETGNRLGQTLLEVLIAIAIFSILAVVLILSLSQLLQRQSVTVQTNLASIELQRTMEDLYAISQTNQWNDTNLQPNDNPSAVYIESNAFGDWSFSLNAPNTKFPSAIYVYPVYRNKLTNEIDSTCTSSNLNCEIDTSFKKLNVKVYEKGTDPLTESLISATYYMTNTSLLTMVGTGPTPTPLPSVPPDPNPTEPVPTDAPAVDSGNDDAQWTGPLPGTLEGNNSTLTLGGGTDSWVGIRFPNVNVPPFSTITSAFVLGKVAIQNWSLDGKFQFVVKGDTNPNSVNFDISSGGLLPNCNVRTCTSSFESYSGSIEISNPAWYQENWYQLGDLTKVVQEMVNDPNWTMPNNLTFLFQGASLNLSTRQIYSFDSGNQPPEFYLTYVTPTPSPTPTSTPTLSPTSTPTPSPTPTPTPIQTDLWYAASNPSRLDVHVNNNGVQINRDPAWDQVEVYDALTNAYLGLLASYHVLDPASALLPFAPPLYQNTYYYEALTSRSWPQGDYWRYHGTKEDFRLRGLPQYIKVKLPPYGMSSSLDLGLKPTPTPTPTPLPTPTICPGATIDQQQTVANFWNGTSVGMGQSFTPSATGQLGYIDVCLKFHPDITISGALKQGEDFNGPLISNAFIADTGKWCGVNPLNGGTWFRFNFGQVPVVKGRLYTVTWLESGPVYSSYPIYNGDIYSGGRAYLGSFVNKDYLFRTAMCSIGFASPFQ